MNHRVAIHSWLVLYALVWLSGCATHADRLRSLRAEFYAGDLRSTERILERGCRSGEQDVFKLDQAMVELAAAKPKQAEQLLREVRDQFDYLEQSSVSEHLLATATDDQRLAYAGEDYEKLLIRVFLALCSLMTDGGDAAAYALQVTDKQQQIIQAGADEASYNPKQSCKRVALGAYLYGLLREETHSNYDDAERAYQKVVEWQPAFRAGRQDLARARGGRHSAPGHGALYVFTLVGRGPYKEQVSEIPTTVALLIADRILSHTASHTVPPTLALIKVPQVVLSHNNVSALAVKVDGYDAGTTETITDVGRLAVDQYRASYPSVMARAIARRAMKKGVVYATKEVVRNADNPLVNLALDAAGVAWEASEAADTRCWGLLPDKIQVLRLELAAGEHRVDLRALCGRQPCGPADQLTVRIAAGRNTYVLANYPDGHLVGTILTNQPAS